MTATLCEWCGAPLPRFGDDDDPTICAGRYACSRRKAMEEGQEDRDAEIATLKAEVARLTKERDNLSLTLRGALARADGVEADLARHQRALAAGPAALRKMTIQYCDDKAEEAAQIVIEAQRRAMEEGKSE